MRQGDLLKAAEDGDTACVSGLVAAGADVQRMDDDGYGRGGRAAACRDPREGGLLHLRLRSVRALRYRMACI